MPPTLSVLIVAWNSRDELARTLPALLPELGEGDELIVVDNDSGDGTRRGGAGAGAAATARRDRRQPRLRRPAATPAPRRPAASCWSSSTPTPRRCPASARRSAGPGCEGRGWAAWQALVADARRDRGSTRPATRSTSPASSGPGATASRSRRRRRPARSRPLRRLPGDPAARPGARSAASRPSSSSTTRTSTSRCGCGCAAGTLGIEPRGGGRPRLRVRRQRAQVALARAQPPRLPRPHLPGLAAGRCWRRPCWRPSWRCSPSPPPAAGGGRSCAANWEFLRWLPRLLRERRAVQATAHGRRRRVRLLADPRPRLPLHLSRRPLTARPPQSCAPTGGWSASCSRSDLRPTRLGRNRMR